MFKRLLLLLLLITPSLQGKEKVTCSEQTVCVYAEQQGQQAKFSVENKALFPVTVRLTFALDNLQIVEHRSLLATYPGLSKTLAVELKPINSSQGTKRHFKFAWQRGALDVKHDDDFEYRLPYAIGSRYPLTQGFNGKFSHKNDNQYAVDFAMPVGTKVHAARGGLVVAVRIDSNKNCVSSHCRNEGNFIAVLHSDGTLGEYHHLKLGGALVALGEQVEQGQIIALSGNTGWSSKPHLHFSVHSATDGKLRRSHAILFRTQTAVVSELEVGRAYVAN